jgi:hypothetical protein
MLCHPCQDTEFPDEAAARSLVPTIPNDLRALLRKLDICGKRPSGLLAAAGTLARRYAYNMRLATLGIAARPPEQLLSPEMINAGMLLRINERIVRRAEGAIAQRSAVWCFSLVSYLVRKAPILAFSPLDRNHIADLLIDDLSAGNGKMRLDVEAILTKLAVQDALINAPRRRISATGS